MADLPTSLTDDLLRPYFTPMLQASTEFVKLIDQAIKLTGTYGNGRLHLEHIFYAIMDSGPNSAQELFMSAGIDLIGFKASILPYLQALPKLPPEPQTVSPNVHDALAGSTEEARQTNHHQVEGVHFLLAALKVTPENPLWHLHDVHYEKVKNIYTQSSDSY